MHSQNKPKQNSSVPGQAMSARRMAWEALNQVLGKNVRAEEALSRGLAKAGLSQQDERLCRELCFGVIKMKALLDYALQPCWKRGKTPPPPLLNLLRLGAYQLLLLSKVPTYAAVFETVALAKILLPLAQAKMVNAVLRKISSQGMASLPDRQRQGITHLTIRYSFPEYIVQRWHKRFGDEACETMLSAANEPPQLWARVNSTRTTPEKLLQAFKDQGVAAEAGTLPTAVRITPGPLSPATIPGLQAGHFYYQDQASQLIGWLVDPRPGQVCLDYCSAPGGKATHLAELLHGTGKVWAHDRQAQKLKRVEENSRRLHLQNIAILEQVPAGLLADRVLVDAPCSGLGTLRRHPEIRWRIQEHEHARLGKEQLTILQKAAGHVVPGGHLIYSTCTTETEENEEVIKAFLSTCPEFSLLPGPGSQQYPDPSFWGADGFFRTFPHAPEFDGMFAARLVKKQ